jgi:hypothetical protein
VTGVVAAPIVSAVIPVALAHASTTGGTGPDDGTGACATEAGGIFALPAGTTSTFTNEVVNGFDDNTLGYTLDSGATFTPLLTNDSTASSVSSSGGQTYTASTAQMLQIELKTIVSGLCGASCDGQEFDYLSSNPNHAVVVQNSSSSWSVYMTDDGCFCCGPTCSRPPDPGTGFYNAAVTITAAC